MMRSRIIASVLVETSTEMLVATTLAHYVGADGRGAYPSVATLATATRLARRTVTRTLGTLVARGVLEARSPRTGGRATTRYDLGPSLRAGLDHGDAERPTSGAASPQPGPAITPSLTEDHPSPDRESADQRNDQSTHESTYAAPALDYDATALLAEYTARWEARHRRSYRPRRRDAEHAAQLAAGRTPRQRERLLARYFASDADPFYAARSHPLALLAKQADDVEQGHCPAPSGPRVLDAAASQRYLRELREHAPLPSDSLRVRQRERVVEAAGRTAAAAAEPANGGTAAATAGHRAG